MSFLICTVSGMAGGLFPWRTLMSASLLTSVYCLTVLSLQHPSGERAGNIQYVHFLSVLRLQWLGSRRSLLLPCRDGLQSSARRGRAVTVSAKLGRGSIHVLNRLSTNPSTSASPFLLLPGTSVAIPKT